MWWSNIWKILCLVKYIRQKKTNILQYHSCRIYKIKQTKEYNNNSKKKKKKTPRLTDIENKPVIISGETEPRKGYEITKWNYYCKASWVAQWSGICLPMQKTCVQALLWKIPHAVKQPSLCPTTEPLLQSTGGTATEHACRDCWGPHTWQPRSATSSPCPATGVAPAQETRETATQHRRPSTAKRK